MSDGKGNGLTKEEEEKFRKQLQEIQDSNKLVQLLPPKKRTEMLDEKLRYLDKAKRRAPQLFK